MFTACLLAAVTVFAVLAPPLLPRRNRLARIYAKMGAIPSQMAAPAAKPHWAKRLHMSALASLLGSMLPEAYRHRIQHLLHIARLDDHFNYEDFLAIKLAATLAVGTYSLLMILKHASTYVAAISAALAVVAFMYPDAWVTRRARSYQDAIRKQLPAFLSALAVALEAGLSLVNALDEVTRDKSDELGFELRSAIELHSKGLSAAEALDRVSTRVEVPDLTIVVASLTQSFEKGADHVVSLVRQQAEEAWQKRRRNAEAIAQTASIKLFLPLMLLAMPGLLVFLVGPAVMQIIKLLKF